MIFMSSSNDSDVSSKLLEYYNVNELPALVGLTANYESNSFNKFKFESEINEANLDEWINNLLANKLEKYFQSDPLPANPLDNGVTIVVGSTFRKIVLNNTNDVFLEIYAPWCTHCTKVDKSLYRLLQNMED
jgi:protein disulfide-isomerase A1